MNYVEVGRKEGARLLGGKALTTKGYFVAPTVFTDVDNSMGIAREEIFGPVAVVIPFKDDNDAILWGNDTIYGLAASMRRDASGRQLHRFCSLCRSGPPSRESAARLVPSSGAPRAAFLKQHQRDVEGFIFYQARRQPILRQPFRR
jgi:hypothetical protein